MRTIDARPLSLPIFLMIRRLRSLKLALLLAYALALQGLAITGASARMMPSAMGGSWCAPGGTGTAETRSPATRSTTDTADNGCCLGTCSAGSAGLAQSDAGMQSWPVVGPSTGPLTALAPQLRRPIQPWSPRGPPIAVL